MHDIYSGRVLTGCMHSLNFSSSCHDLFAQAASPLGPTRQREGVVAGDGMLEGERGAECPL